VLNVKLAPVVGGFIIGLVVGMFVLSGPAISVASSFPAFFTIGTAILTFVAGILLGRKTTPKPHEIKLTGRVFEFPQGSVMVEVALRRAKSIIPVRVTQE